METTQNIAAGHRMTEAHRPDARRAKKAKAKAYLSPNAGVPSLQQSFDPAGPVQNRIDSHAVHDTDRLVERIVGLHRERERALKTKLMTANNMMAGVRDALGFRTTLPEAERKEICRRADLVVKAVTKKKPVPEDLEQIAVEFAAVIKVSSACVDEWERRQKRLQKKMEQAAKLLPVYPWVASIKGLGACGLAMLIGEAGRSLSLFPNPDKLRKMLAMAPADEYRRPDSRGKEVAMIPRQRRSVVWRIGYSLLMNKENVYEQRYRAERERLRIRGDIKTGESWDGKIDQKTGKQKVHPHCDNLARLIARRAMVKDLWVAWREAERNGRLSADSHGSAAAASPLAPAA